MNQNLSAPMLYLPGTGWVDRPSELAPEVDGDLSCEVAVIGGGLGGMAAALRLAELGRDVVLVEADVCGWGASGRNAGYLTNTVGSDPRILSRFYADRLRGLYSFANNSVGFAEELMARHAIECDYLKTGFFVAAATVRGFEQMASKAKNGKRSVTLDARAAGVPPAFHGGTHIKVGGVMNPGKFSLGLRETALGSSARVFERSPVQGVVDDGTSVSIELPRGRIHANHVILTANAFTGDLDVAPRWLAKPVRVTAVEAQQVPPELLDEAGWTSRLPIVTTHRVMESYRTTSRDTIVFTTRRLQMPYKPLWEQQPDQALVADLVRGFRERFPTLSEVLPQRAWAGWIGMTPSNLAVAGRATRRVFYSMACNGHGLGEAPYLGNLLAEHVAGKDMHDDLRAVWRDIPRFAPGIVNPLSLRAAWLADRLSDRLDRRR